MTADVQRLNQEIDELEQRLATAERAHDDAQTQIAKLRQEIDDISDQRRGATLARQHEGSQFRSSMAGFIQDDGLGLLAAIREGLELEPPRVPFSLERLEDAEHTIESKVRWLKSS